MLQKASPLLNRLSIKAKLTLAIASLAFFASLLVLVMAFNLARDGITDLVGAQLTATVQIAAAEMDHKLGSTIQVLEQVAFDLAPALESGPQQAREAIGHQRALAALFSNGTSLIDHDGIIVADFPRVAGRIGGSVADKDWFKEVMLTNKPAIGRPTIGRFTDKPILAIAVPIFGRGGKQIGVLASSSQLGDNNLFGILQSTKLGKSGYMLVISRRDRLVVAATDTKRILTPIPPKGVNPLFDKRFYENFEGVGISTNSFGIETLTANKYLKNADWMVNGGIPTEEAFFLLMSLKREIFLIGIIVLIGNLTAIYLLMARLLRPLSQAASAMHTMVIHDQNPEPLPVLRNDEIGEMVGAFNHLIAKRRHIEALLLQGEERYKSVIDGMSDAVVIRDANGEIISVNKSAERLFAGDLDSVRGLPYENVPLTVHYENGDRVPPTEWPSNRVLNGEGVIVHQLYRFDFPDQRRLWLNVSAFPLHDGASKQLSGVVSIFSDVTDQRHNQQLTTQKEAAELANQTKSRFLASMSHELRTPLNAILGFSQLMEFDPVVKSTPSLAKKLQHVLAAGRHLLAMIDDVLDLSKIEADKLALELMPQPLSEVARDCLELTQMLAQKRNIRTELDIQDADAWAAVDRTRVRQIMVNLLSNAIKYNREGGSVIAQVGGNDDQVFIAVCDTGPGLSPEQIGGLFQPFNRLGAEATAIEGTGIGLVIVKRLAEAMGGQITVSSQLGKGSTFSVIFPRSPKLQDATAVTPG